MTNIHITEVVVFMLSKSKSYFQQLYTLYYITQYYYYNTLHYSVGIVTDITKLEVVHNSIMIRHIKVDFPECHQWMGPYDVIEKAPPEVLKVW